MILKLLSQHADLVAGAILVSPGYRNRVHPDIHWITDFATEVVAPGKPLSLNPYAVPYMTNKSALARSWSADPMIHHRITPKDLLDVYHINSQGMAEAKNIPPNFPILIIAGLDDGLFKTAELPKAIKKFGTHNVSLNLLPGKGHILLEDQAVDPQMALLIDSWLNQQSSQGSKNEKKRSGFN